MKNSYSIEIDAPADRVFDLIYDGDRIKEWIPTLIENETLISTDSGVGSTFRHPVYLENGKHMEVHGEVVAFEQDRYKVSRKQLKDQFATLKALAESTK